MNTVKKAKFEVFAEHQEVRLPVFLQLVLERTYLSLQLTEKSAIS